MRSILTTCAAILLATGCYVEEMPDRSPSPSGVAQQPRATEARDSHPAPQSRRAGECFHGDETGCVEGNIQSAMNLTVDGKSFFDADDLATRFGEIVEIRSVDGKVLSVDKDYDFDLVGPFSNRDFAKDFQVFLKGERMDSLTVRVSGKFSLNDLPEGEYDIRVQRPIKMRVEIKQLEGDPVVKVYCASLYQDSSFEVIQGEKSEPLVFDDFRLYTTATECAQLR